MATQPRPATASRTTATAPRPPGDVRALSRGLAILRAVALDATSRGMTLGGLAEATGMHKSTVHRLVAVLLRDRLLWRDPENDRYRLGIATLELGGAYLDRITPRRIALPYLEQLMSATNETVHLGILDEYEVVFIEKIEAPANVIVHTRIGRRDLLHCTAIGKAMLAYLPEEELRKVIERGLPGRTSATATDERKLRSVLAVVRKRGFAVNLEESRELINAVAAPIFDRLARPVAAVAISGLKQRLPMERLLELGAQLKHTAGEISTRLGYAPG